MSKFADKNTATSLLLVEGPEDKEVLGALLQVKQIEPEFAVSVETGLTNLKQAFRTGLKATNIRKKLWVLADADSDCGAKWQMLRDCMIEHGGYDVSPRTPLPEGGAVFTPKKATGITVGIWIMPDNSRPGMLEDFITLLVKADDTLIGHAQSVVDRLDADRNSHPSLFRPVHRSKAIVHTWLAWQDKPGRSMGTAILRNRLELEAPLCSRFIGWVQDLRPDDVTLHGNNAD